MKKLLLCGTLLLALLCLPGAMAQGAETNPLQSGDYRYTPLPEGGAEIIKYTGKAADLTIPAQLDGHAVRRIGENAFSECFSLTSITLPDGLQSIGDYAFSYCFSLASVTLPEGLQSIGDRAFAGCPLASITLPDGLQSIGEYAFANCPLTSITLPDGLQTIGDRAFASCDSLTSIILPDGLQSIGDEAFYRCSSLTSITLPDGLQTIGDSAFSGCSLASITLPDGLQSIGDSAFDYCSALTGLIIPASVMELGSDFCDDDTILTVEKDSYAHRWVEEYNDSYSWSRDYQISFRLVMDMAQQPWDFIADDYLYQPLPDGGAQITGYIGKEGELSIPGQLESCTVLSIGEDAFYGCDFLISVSLPDTLQHMGVNPFRGCTQLKEIQVSNDHAHFTVEKNVLFSKEDKRLICYPAGMEAESYQPPRWAEIIGENGFFGCEGLKNILLPASIHTVEDNPFRGCTGLKKILVSPDHPHLSVMGGVLFSKSDKRLICYPAHLENAFYAVPEGIQIIGNYAFSGNEALIRVQIANSIRVMGQNPFAGCAGLQEIQVPANHAYLENREGVLFSKSDKRLIRYPANLTNKSYTVPQEIAIIGEAAFAGCENLHAVTIPAAVMAIGRDAFAGIPYLELTVERDSYARRWAVENEMPHLYPDSGDWLQQ